MVRLRPGQLFGRYRVLAEIATGGFANVYRAHREGSTRKLALKVPSARRPDAEVIADFRHEARENLRLRHPNVVPVVDHGEVDGVPYLVMPLGRGSLADLIDGGLPVAKALRYGRQLLLALAHVHAHHLIHCDVKPDNLILLSNDRVALADFGLARRGWRTVVGDGSGTMGFMAPEQAAGRPSARSDVYAAGIVLATLLFGSLKRAKIPYDHPRVRRLPPGLIELIARATDLDPSRRFRDAGEMLAELRRVEARARRARKSKPR
jgi:serine/threonine protein kinase